VRILDNLSDILRKILGDDSLTLGGSRLAPILTHEILDSLTDVLVQTGNRGDGLICVRQPTLGSLTLCVDGIQLTLEIRTARNSRILGCVGTRVTNPAAESTDAGNDSRHSRQGAENCATDRR